mgnify:CR=1 FL=1
MDTEQEIISILLNRPNDKYITQINEDWFTNAHLKWAYEAIRDNEDTTVEPLTVYGWIKNKYPDATIKLNQIVELKRQYLNDAPLDGLVTKLHKIHLTSELINQMNQYMDAPTDANRTAVQETMGILDNLNTNDDDGSIKEALDRLGERLTTEQPTGIKSVNGLDRILSGGLYGGMLMTIGARPGVGKTAFSVNMAYEIMQQDPEVRVDYFTLEMNSDEMMNRFVSREAGVNSNALKNPVRLPDKQKTYINESRKNFYQSNLRIYTRLTDLAGILRMIRRNASRAKPNKYVAFVDYIGLISVRTRMDRYLQVGEITRQLKIAANEYNVPIIELSQLSRGIANRVDKRPVLSDLRESGSIEQDSNVVAFLYEPDEDNRNIKYLAVEKNREGQIGDVYYDYIGGKMRFDEIPASVVEGS